MKVGGMGGGGSTVGRGKMEGWERKERGGYEGKG